ncbi:MAG: hypothetical protein ABIP12_03025 [Terriglobales bacterium]
MKLGFDNKRETAWMVGLVILAVVLASRYFMADAPVISAPKSSAKGPAVAPSAARQLASSRGRNKDIYVLRRLRPSLDPSLRFDLLNASEDKEYEGGRRNIFREYVQEVAIDKPIAPVVPVLQPDPGPPPPPPIPLKYYGFASKPGEARKVFLSSGDEVFIAEEGQIIQRRYKILKITVSSVEVEDVLNNNKQVIPLTQG